MAKQRIIRVARLLWVMIGISFNAKFGNSKQV